MIPHLFRKEPLLPITNPSLNHTIDTVKKAKTQHEAVKTAYRIITAKYQGYRFRTYLLFWKEWEKDPNKLWLRSGFLHCTQMNYLLRVLLIRSGWFTEDDISLGYSLVFYISIHQYLVVRLKDGDRMAIDPWNASYGATLGQYASGFGYKSL